MQRKDEPMSEYVSIYKDILCSNGLSDYCTDEIIEKLHEAQVEITEKNKHLNLTAITDEKEFISKHWADSLRVVKYIPENSSVLDVGTGGGILAFAIAIARKDVKVTAIDSTDKKIRFVNELKEKLGLDNMQAFSTRAEELGKSKQRESFDFVCARAVAALPVLSELCVPLVKVGGTFASLKGKNGKNELNEAEKAYKTLGCDLLMTDDSNLVEITDGNEVSSERYIFLFRKSRKTPNEYPRQYSNILKKPIN